MTNPGKIGPSDTWKEIGAAHAEYLARPDGWDNFRRTIASRYFTDEDYTEADIRYAYEYLRGAGVRVEETDLAEGNPVSVEIDGRIITQDLLISASELAAMEKVIDFRAAASFAEIGGGYGRMAHLLLQRYPHIRYTIIDVPPAIEVSRRYLGGKYKVEFRSPEQALEMGAADVFYSSSVLSELDFEKVAYYFRLVAAKGSYFYLKDWKTGHHLNDMPRLRGLALRAVNKAWRAVTGKSSAWAEAGIDAYRISERSYPEMGWKELLRRDCENITGFSPAKGIVPAEKGFFEVVYKIK